MQEEVLKKHYTEQEIIATVEVIFLVLFVGI